MKTELRALARWLVYTSLLGRACWQLVNLSRGAIYRARLPSGTRVSWSAQLLGISNVQLGRNTVIGDRSWLNVNNRVQGTIAISIGDNCFIGRDNFLSSGASIQIREYCLTARNCQFISATHVYDTPERPYIATGTTTTDRIYVGANCFFAAGATVLGNVTIGHGCVIGAGSLVRRNVPPFSLVVGTPAKVVKRFDFGLKLWVPADRFTGEELIPNEDDYINQLRANFATLSMPTIAAIRAEGEL